MKTINLEEFGNPVESPTDYIHLMENVLDSYTMGLDHGLQKDAIQNGVDARKRDKKWKDWSFTISLIENEKGNFLILEDSGTVGLTGKLTAKDVKNIFPNQEERWARFESLAFGKNESSSLGARGQGKLIMFRSSKSHTLVYDSLREDKSYRMGMSKISNTGRTVLALEGKEAEKALFRICGLTPLSHVGTRVIVIDPDAEVIAAIEDDSMLSYVEDTWWPIILAGGKIRIIARGAEVDAEIPLRIKQLRAKGKNNNPQFKVEKISNRSFTAGKGKQEKFEIKELVIGYDANGIPEENQGISIFRGGMKIENYSVKTDLHPETENIYGYIICSEKLDEALRENELPSHYGFRSKTGICAKLEREIDKTVADFARSQLKIGENREPESDNFRSATMKDAMRLFTDVIKDLHLFGTEQGSGGGGGGNNLYLKKPISLTIENLQFPDPTFARVNYGDKLENFKVCINNRTITSLKYELIGHIKQGGAIVSTLETFSGKSVSGKKIEHPLEKQNKYAIPINEEIFSYPGVYTLEFQLLDSSSRIKRQQAIVSRKFYVAQDPPLPAGPFKVESVDFNKYFPEMAMKQSFLQRAGDDSILYVNITHAAYESNEYNLKAYLALLYTEAALQISIEGIISGDIDPKKVKVPFDLNIMSGNDPVEVLKERHKAMGFFADKIYKKRTW